MFAVSKNSTHIPKTQHDAIALFFFFFPSKKKKKQEEQTHIRICIPLSENLQPLHKIPA